MAFLPVNFFCCGSITVAAMLESPPLCILDSNQLTESKKRIGNNDSTLRSAVARLERDANHSLTHEPFAVTHKELAPPSSDKHDYMSIAPYWWPNPATTNGLPYVRRDGEINPERDQTSDHKRLDNLVQSVKSLALAYFLTGREEYAAHGAKLLRAWFLDDATKMNPNLRYAQAVPGRNQGRGAGIIETHTLPELLDAVGLLGNSKSWNQADQKSLQNWFSAYLSWLLESSEGKAEAKAQNNHGTWYDVQSACFARFVGRDEIAKKIMAEFPVRRLAKQIEIDGRQPQELARTQSWSYAIFNLEAFFAAAAIADRVGVDLWHYEATDKRAIRKALDWLVPFATGEKKWNYPQITPFGAEKLAPLLRRAALVFHQPAYEKAISQLPKIGADERWRLHYPTVIESK
ncbi:MAG TPA: alginate lyase family protein [Candidatus Binatia bacterium]